MLEVPAEAILEILNQRAQSDPLIKEILRSTMYEVAFKMQTAETEPEEKKEE